MLLAVPPPSPPYPDVTGALIAGGRASRLGGRPKGLLLVEGEPIAARSLRLFGRLFGASLLVADDPAPYAALGATALPDAIPGKGAPGGLHAALRAARTPWVFAAACDMPFLSAEAVALLADRRGGATAVVPRWAGRLEPLHALWSVACLPALEAALAGGHPSLRWLAGEVGAEVIEEAAWREVDPAGLAFENANTPGDLERLGLG
jgi:molybdopterin-guanine dinucleotide biosynthesis protein A